MIIDPIVKGGCLLVLTGLFGCAHLASVQPGEIALPLNKNSPAGLIAAEERLSEAQKQVDQKPLLGLGNDLAAAQLTLAQLSQHKNESEARDLYNFAVARVVENLQRNALQPWNRALHVPTPDGPFVLSGPTPTYAERDLANSVLLPADRVKLGSRLFTERSVVDGIGAPIVAIARSAARGHTRFEPSHIYAAETALLTFQDHRARIEFLD